MRLKWTNCAKNDGADRRVKYMLTLDDIILDEFGPEHIQLKNLIKFMLIVDHGMRPTATDCLRH